MCPLKRPLDNTENGRPRKGGRWQGSWYSGIQESDTRLGRCPRSQALVTHFCVLSMCVEARLQHRLMYTSPECAGTLAFPECVPSRW